MDGYGIRVSPASRPKIMEWNEEELARLQKYWKHDGLSAAAIGRRLGCSRSAVLGKVHRLGWNERTPDAIIRHAANTSRLGAKLKPRKLKFVLTQSVAPPEPLLLSVSQLAAHTCKFPVGDPKDKGFGFCGHQTVPPFSYCAFHCAQAFQAVAVKPPRRPADPVPPYVHEPDPTAVYYDRLMAA